MIFKNHSNIEGLHAILGASKYHWLNYSDDKLLDYYNNITAAKRGVQLHEFAASAIKIKQRLPKSTKTINAYVNDAIGYGMSTEVVLFYSENCFGTADAILFKNNILRIHDLKTGVTPGHMEQLEIYAALFCLEYGVSPGDIQIELRLYQNDTIVYSNPDAPDIAPIMSKIKYFDKLISKQKEQELE